jgi:hypothetical protein
MSMADKPSPALLTPAISAYGSDFFEVVHAADQGLRRYPFFIVLRGLPAGIDCRAIDALMRALSTTPPDGEMDLSIVQVRPMEAENTERGTRYSRTHRALPPHTDSTYMENPHSIVAFQMVRTDREGGGRSIVVPVQDVVERLGASMTAALREARAIFGQGERFPILWESEGSPSMRYYRTQIDFALADLGEEIVAEGRCLDAIDEVLADLSPEREFDLAEGEVLLLNNHKVLHGRTGMAIDSERLLYRFRAHLAEANKVI